MKFIKRSNGWFAIQMSSPETFIDIYIWCQNVYGPCGDRWEHYAENYMFKKESDVTMFILRWS